VKISKDIDTILKDFGDKTQLSYHGSASFMLGVSAFLIKKWEEELRELGLSIEKFCDLIESGRVNYLFQPIRGAIHHTPDIEHFMLELFEYRKKSKHNNDKEVKDENKF
jgi:hypothetical protein